MWSLIVLIFISIHVCASESICETLRQFHGNKPPMSIDSPFTIVTSAPAVNQSEILIIKIKSIQKELRFGKFIINARSTSPPYTTLGRFTSSIDGLRLTNCDGVDNTAAHVSENPTGDIELQWQAPIDYIGEVLFKATIAQQYDINWVGIESAPVQIVQRGDAVAKLPLPNARIKQRNNDLIYEGCGTTKTCFGYPNDCVVQQSCQAIATAININNRFQFELQSNADNVAYVAFGLSRDVIMGEDTVMECVREEGVVRAYSSWNIPRPTIGSTREGVQQNITLLDSSLLDGAIYCRLEHDAVTTNLRNQFDLANESFHFMVAIGSTALDSSVGRHDLGRIVSTEPLDIIQEQSDPIYEGCGATKTCFGFPNNCVEQQSCQAIATAVFIDNRFQIELKSDASNVAYVALGLSRDTTMGEDSVMECIPEGDVVRTYNSWNTPRPNLGTIREEVPQHITRLLSSSYVNGTIYCKLEREPIASKLESEFNLLKENFHFMLAIGSTSTASSIGSHNLGRIVSSQPLRIIGMIHTDDSIYEECGKTKICFGLPTNCVERKSCEAIATAVVLNNCYKFELQSSADNVAYVALGLSRDNLMGEDSVIECVQEGGIIRAYSSWNTASYQNTRVGVQQNIVTLLNSSYVDGTIYCKVQREPITTILGTECDLVNDNFHFLLAIGSNVTGSSCLEHDLGRVGSSEPITLNENVKGNVHFAHISIMSIVVWFLATIYANYLYGQ